MKKSIYMIAAVASALIAPTPLRAAQAEETKFADVYIVAGQSNAAGYSETDQGSPSYRDRLVADDGRNGTGYTNVAYYGEVDRFATGAATIDYRNSVKIGYGNSASRIGPELGMAKILSESYTGNDTAVIVKYAAGGTYLTDYEGYYPQTVTYGNWASPTATARAQEQGIVLHANNGLLYQRLLSSLQYALSDLKTRGYTPVVKGYFFMQGEADATSATLAGRYEEALKTFIDDLRKDVAEIAEDEFAAMRPFVVGKINSSGWYGDYIENVRAAQTAVCNSVSGVYATETNDLLIHDEHSALLGSDDWHFNAWDMYALGKRFATCAQENGHRYLYSVKAGAGGAVEQNAYLTNGGAFSISYTTERGKQLSKVLFNGSDVTAACVQNGAVTVNPASYGEGGNRIELVFENAQAYALTVTCGEGGKVTRSIGGNVVYAGDSLTVTPAAYVGYKVDKVICNGAELTADEHGNYAVTVSGDCEISVTFAKAQTSESGTPENPEKGGLPAWGIALIAVGGALAAGGIALGVVLIVKKRKK